MFTIQRYKSDERDTIATNCDSFLEEKQAHRMKALNSTHAIKKLLVLSILFCFIFVSSLESSIIRIKAIQHIYIKRLKILKLWPIIENISTELFERTN